MYLGRKQRFSTLRVEMYGMDYTINLPVVLEPIINYVIKFVKLVKINILLSLVYLIKWMIFQLLHYLLQLKQS